MAVVIENHENPIDRPDGDYLGACFFHAKDESGQNECTGSQHVDRVRITAFSHDGGKLSLDFQRNGGESVVVAMTRALLAECLAAVNKASAEAENENE